MTMKKKQLSSVAYMIKAKAHHGSFHPETTDKRRHNRGKNI